jgi:hypothetical protein
MPTFQTNALNFTLFTRLGGTERNPAFSVDQGSPDYVKPDRQNLYNFEQEELGILDLSLVPGSKTIGVRFVNWIWIASPTPPSGPEPGLIEVVDSVSLETMRLISPVIPAPGFEDTYFTAGVAVPQGASIRFQGEWLATPDTPVRLRVGLVPATDNLEWAAQKIALCCTRGENQPFVPVFRFPIPDGDGPPLP